jgi:starvation-inducible outer membrane lipoprotein
MTTPSVLALALATALCGCLSIPENIRAELQAQPTAQNHFDPTGKAAAPAPASAAPTSAPAAPVAP